MVAGGFEVVLYQVTEDRPCRCCSDAAIGAGIIIVVVCRLSKVSRQHVIGLLVITLSRRINQYIRCLVTVGDALQAVIVEQWLVELVYPSG